MYFDVAPESELMSRKRIMPLMHVYCCSKVGGDLFEQLVDCFVIAGFKHFQSVLLRLVSK